MEKQEMEMKRKLEMETGNGNRKLKTEMEMQLLPCCRGGAGISKVVRPLQIKDHSCMYRGGGGSTTDNVRQ